MFKFEIIIISLRTHFDSDGKLKGFMWEFDYAGTVFSSVKLFRWKNNLFLNWQYCQFLWNWVIPFHWERGYYEYNNIDPSNNFELICRFVHFRLILNFKRGRQNWSLRSKQNCWNSFSFKISTPQKEFYPFFLICVSYRSLLDWLK